MAENKNKVDLSKNLQSLKGISDWFDSQTEIDIEQGLTKVKEAATLIKESKNRLKEVENEFEEIKREIADEVLEEMEVPRHVKVAKKATDEEEVNPEDIPF